MSFPDNFKFVLDKSGGFLKSDKILKAFQVTSISEVCLFVGDSTCIILGSHESNIWTTNVVYIQSYKPILETSLTVLFVPFSLIVFYYAPTL